MPLDHQRAVARSILQNHLGTGSDGYALGSHPFIGVGYPFLPQPFLRFGQRLWLPVILLLVIRPGALFPVDLVEQGINVVLFRLRLAVCQQVVRVHFAHGDIFHNGVDVTVPLRLIGNNGGRRMDDASGRIPAGIQLDPVGAGELCNAVVPGIVIPDTLLDLLLGDGGVKAKVGHWEPA